MNKKALLKFLCLVVFVLTIVQIANSATQNSTYNPILNAMIAQNNQFANCSSAASNEARQILGISNGKCHYYSNIITFGNKRQPTLECFVPMNVLKQEVSKQNQMLSKGTISYNSKNDPFTPYCKQLHGTINSNYGSMSY